MARFSLIPLGNIVTISLRIHTHPLAAPTQRSPALASKPELKRSERAERGRGTEGPDETGFERGGGVVEYKKMGAAEAEDR